VANPRTGPHRTGFKPTLLPEELLSSWVARSAWGFGLTYRGFLKLSGNGKGHALDLDSHWAPDHLEHLTATTGCDRSALADASLRGLSSVLAHEAGFSGEDRWVTSYQMGRHKGLEGGVPFCPHCFREEAVPYVRRQWRLAFVSVCEPHRCFLRATCPHCRVPFNFRALAASAPSMAHCQECGADLREERSAEGRLTVTAGVNICRTQSRLLNTLRAREVRLSRDVTIPVSHYFALLQTVIALFLSTRGRRLWSRTAEAALSGVLPAGRRNNIPMLRFLPAETRGRLIDLAVFLLDEWPRRLLDLCLWVRLKASDFQRTTQRGRLNVEEEFICALGGDRRPFRRDVAEYLRLTSENGRPHGSTQRARVSPLRAKQPSARPRLRQPALEPRRAGAEAVA